MKRHYKTPLIGRLSIPSPRLLAASPKGITLYDNKDFDSSKEALGRESDDWDDDE